MNDRENSLSHRTAFTPVELLVFISIIGKLLKIPSFTAVAVLTLSILGSSPIA